MNQLQESINTILDVRLSNNGKIPQDDQTLKQAKIAVLGLLKTRSELFGNKNSIKQTLNRFVFELYEITDHWSAIFYSFRIYPKGGYKKMMLPYADAEYKSERIKYKDIGAAVESVETNPESVYRGMSLEEFILSKKRGFFKSNGLYNIGDDQQDYTFFGNDFSTGQFYAGGFQPIETSNTRKYPGVIIEMPKRIFKKASDIKNDFGHGVGHDKEYVTKDHLPYSLLKNIWFLVSESSKAGSIDIVYDKFKKSYREGSRSSPSEYYKIVNMSKRFGV